MCVFAELYFKSRRRYGKKKLKNCLVIEDEFLIGCFVKSTLERGGYKVGKIIDNEPEGVAAILKMKPDFVVVDKNLKDYGCGIRIVKKCKEKLDIPYLFITGSSKEILERINAIQCPSLMKPFDAEALLQFVEENK